MANLGKVSIDVKDLKTLAVSAKANGTQDAFIDIAMQWAEAMDMRQNSMLNYLKNIRDGLTATLKSHGV